MEINHESTNKLDKKHSKSAVTNKAKIRIPEVISEKLIQTQFTFTRRILHENKIQQE
jgi:hypothetical protein